jgi:hypothetical protein
MVFCQIVLTSATSTVSIPVTGICNIQLLNVQAHYTDVNATSRLVEIQCDELYLPYSAQKYPVFVTNGVVSNSWDNSTTGFHIEQVRLKGQMTLTLNTKASYGALGALSYVVLSLDIEKVGEL